MLNYKSKFFSDTSSKKKSQLHQRKMFSLESLISAIIITITLVILYIKWSYRYWERKRIPYITPTIPFGNLESPLNIKNGLTRHMASLYNQFREMGCKHGGFFSVTRPVYMPVDLDYVKNITVKNFQHFMDRGKYYHEKADPLTANLVFIEGQKWRNLRAKVTSVFTSGKMKFMFQTVLDSGNQMKKILDEMYSETQTFDMKDISRRFTMDVIGSVAFGLECNSFKNPNSDFMKYGRKLFGSNMDRIIREFLSLSFPKMCKRLGMRLYLPDATSFFTKVVSDIVNYRESNQVHRNDYLQLLLDLKDKAETTLTFQEISAQAFVFYLAGFETSSTAMSFCLYELAKNSSIQEKLRREINDVLAKHEDAITYDCLQEMIYMTQVIEESLRKYPPIPQLNRICTKDCVLPDGAVLEKGTRVFIPIYAIHQDPKYYPEPDRFDPERFSFQAKMERHPFAFLPFGEGPRICIGLRFGLMQVKIGLTILLKDYAFSLNPKTPNVLTINPKTITLSSMENILLDVKKIA